MNSNRVKTFYDQLQFPGHYSLESLDYHIPEIRNIYLKAIDQVMGDGLDVLDVGCGSGVITNLFAKKYPMSSFTALDFSDAIYYAQSIAQQGGFSNTMFIHQDLLLFDASNQYDVVICQGVLHHIPNHKAAIDKLTQLVKPGGVLVLGLYHPWGKLAKKVFNIDYQNQVLFRDQEEHPYETAFDKTFVDWEFPDFETVSVTPSLLNTCIGLYALFNYRNGGLATYVLKRNSNV